MKHFAFCLFAILVPSAAIGQTSLRDLLATELIPADLEDATKLIAKIDFDDDGVLNSKEQARLVWKDIAEQFDIDRSASLSHLEIAYQYAKRREESGVTQIDRNIANKRMLRYDRNKNGQLDSAEIAAGWPPNPEDFDSNNDTVITLPELTQGMAMDRFMRTQLGIMGVDQGGALKLMNRFDINGNHFLDANEWEASPLPLKPGEFDNNDDERLSTLELATMLAKHRKTSGLNKADQLQARSIFLTMDIDRNGVATKEELQARAIPQQTIDAFDRDKDGQITTVEVEAALIRQREQKGFSEAQEALAKRVMLRLDLNRDNRLSPGEFAENRVALKQSRFDSVDTDNDRSISLDELARQIPDASSNR